jgi:hypothetical protein
MTLGGYEGRCTDQGGGAGRAIIEGSGAGGAAISGSGKGCAVIGFTEGGGGLVAGGMSSWREVSQLDDDVFPPSNWWITLLLASTADLLLERTASVTVFTCFHGGSGGVGVELAEGGGIHGLSRSGSSGWSCYRCRLFSLHAAQ